MTGEGRMSLKDLIINRSPDEIMQLRLKRALESANKKVRKYYPDDRIAQHVAEIFRREFDRAARPQSQEKEP